MAYPTVSAPYGFKPVNLIGGRVYSGSTRMIPIAEAYATGIYNGDLVGFTAGTLKSSAIAYNTNSPVAGTLGVFAGCEYSTLGGPIYGKNRYQYWAASTIAQDAIAYVVDDPNAVFKVAVLAQSSAGASNTATTLGAVSQAYVGSNVSAVTGTAGSTATGDSAWGVSSSTAPTNQFGVVRTTTTLPFRIVQLVPETVYSVVASATTSGSSTTVTLAAAPAVNTTIQAGMQIIVPNTTGTGYVTAGYPGDYNYVTNVNSATITIATAVNITSATNVTFLAYPEVYVTWSGTYHSYNQAAGV